MAHGVVFAKGVYPYMSSRNKFAETQLPPIEAFHDILKDEPLSQEDYTRAQQVWSRFDMCSMQQYHDHYLLTDVLLLADVFEYFRRSVLITSSTVCTLSPCRPSSGLLTTHVQSWT